MDRFDDLQAISDFEDQDANDVVPPIAAMGPFSPIIHLMKFGPDYHIDIDGMQADSGGGSAQSRPWIGVRFDCCGVYQRIYRSPDGAVYQGRCPKCTRQVTAKVGPDGINCRFFTAE